MHFPPVFGLPVQKADFVEPYFIIGASPEKHYLLSLIVEVN